MPEGIIMKALSGYYFVAPDLNNMKIEPVRCRARGVFKLRGQNPLVGDRVIYELTENGEGTVKEILPRISELIRPPVANVELAVLLFSIDEPALNLQLLDKFLVHTERAGLNSIICFTKSDLNDEEHKTSEKQTGMRDYDAESSIEPEELLIEEYIQLYSNIGYEVYQTSALEGWGLEPIMNRLSGKISVFAGQSGVGKSSLLNAIVPGLLLETGPISMKLGRGKHTTRHVELIPLQNGGVVADTPGFSQLDFTDMEKERLGDCFKEFKSRTAECRFRGCIHKNEPGCAVIDAVEKGDIAKTRHAHYIHFLDELMSTKRRY